MNQLFTDADVIYRYSRAQALADGVLVDVSDMAREAGFHIPVALTTAVWADCVQWTEETAKRKDTPQDETGRLWDVLFMANRAALRNKGASRVAFVLYRVLVEGRGIRARYTTLEMTIGPDDNAEPVITISLPGED